MHHHSGDQWSGVFWLSGDQYESGDLWIMNPMRNSCLSTHFHGCAEHNASIFLHVLTRVCSLDRI